jgi:isoleucyl-tRNA synthetase
MGSPVMKGEDIIISEDQYKMQVRGTLLILWNVYNFFVSYAIVDKFELSSANHKPSSNTLDKWILSLTNRLILDVTAALDSYDTVMAITKIQEFVNSLSTWYIRRSRVRVGPSAENNEDKQSFYQTSFAVLTNLSKLLAPITPFISEEIFRNLTNGESVHLSDWPKPQESLIDEKIEQEMAEGTQVASVILARRKAAEVPVRVPLKKLSYSGPRELSQDVLKIVLEEINIGNLEYEGKQDLFVSTGSESELTSDSNQDQDAGLAREIIRKIQAERKKMETKLDERVDVEIPDWPGEFEGEIKRKALIDKLTKSSEFRVLRKNA